MCNQTQHRAESSVLYINNQLEAKWESAKRFATNQYFAKFEPSAAFARASTCLYEFFVHEPNGRGFYAKFGAPKVEFLCNHELILFLTVTEFNVEFPKAPVVSGDKGLEIIIPYLVRFDTNVYQDSANNTRGYTAGHAFEIHTIQIDSAAQLAHPFEKSFSRYKYKDTTRAKLLDYIKDHYLPAFKSAGHHVLHALPDHDNLLETTAHIDYSFRAPVECRAYVEHIHGVHIDDINRYLSALWTLYVNAGKKPDVDLELVNGERDDSVLRAQIQTEWINRVNGVKYRLVLGQPKAEVFCTREVVLYVDVETVEVLSNNSTLPKSTWTLAFVADVVRVESSGVTCLKIDIEKTRLRFRKSLSKNVTESNDGYKLHKELIDYVEKHFFEEVNRLDCRVIYKDHLPVLKPAPVPIPAGDVGFPNVHECPHHACVAWDAIWRRGLEKDLCEDGYDTVTTISQASINAHFAALFKQHQQQGTWKTSGGVVLSEWSYTFGNEVFFRAVYDRAPRIQLQLVPVFSDLEVGKWKCKAIVYLFVKEGELRVVNPDVTLTKGERLKVSAKKYDIAGWRIALEVDLDIVQTTISSHEQLVVDFTNARVLPEYSYLPTALSWQDAALTALTFYLAESYITDLRDFHTLYTVPLTTKIKHTHFKPQVVPFCIGAGLTYRPSEHAILICENVGIVLLGMFGGRTPPDLVSGKKGWVVPETRTYISRRLFLDSVLRTLEQVNEKTAVVANPNFAQLDASESFLQLTPYGAVYKRKGLPFAWKRGVVEDGGSLSYEWNNRDEWRYEHVGDFVGSGDSGSYYVTVITHNKLNIPIGAVGDLSSTISVASSVTFDVSRVQMGGKEDWSGTASVDWSQTYALKGNTTGGIDIVSSTSHVQPTFPPATFSGDTGKHLWAKLTAQLKEFAVGVDLSGIGSELQKTLNGLWTGSDEQVVKSVVFNRDGDLVLESERREAAVVVGSGGAQTVSGYLNGYGQAKIETVNTTRWKETTVNGRNASIRPYHFR